MEFPSPEVELPDCQLNWEFLKSKLPPGWPVTPACSLRHSVQQTIPNGAWTTVAFDTEIFDTSNMHVSTANTKITVQTPGLYLCHLNVQFLSNAVGIRYIRLALNNTTELVLTDSQAVNGDATVIECTRPYRFAKNDYIEGQVFQGSGGNLNIEAIARTPLLSAVWMSA